MGFGVFGSPSRTLFCRINSFWASRTGQGLGISGVLKLILGW